MKLSEASKYLADKRVLITGHTGFKGIWLTLLLEEFAVEVWGLSLEPDEKSLYTRLNRAGIIPEAFIDIRDREKLDLFMDRCQPDIVFHLAAQPLVLESYRDPLGTLETNIMGTANVINKAIKLKNSKLIAVITTDKVYENQNLGNRFVETDSLIGKDPYSASKVGAEAVVSAFRSLNRNESIPKIVSFRAGNVIGGGDYAENRLIPDLIRSIEKNQALEIRNPYSTRPWQHVLDPLSGYIRGAVSAIQKENFDSLNFGPNEKSLTVMEVLEISKKSSKHQIIMEIDDSKKSEKESALLDLDSSLANELLDWEPTWSQSEAVKLTIEWWSKVLDNEASPREACSFDIKEFLKLNGN
jgi:CDP-glucose 4,6-dehydratase